MSLDKLRYSFTEHTERIFLYKFKNFELLIHPSINNYDLLNRLEDDINLLPEIPTAIDKTEIKFYTYGYKEQIYSKDELLSFLFAVINHDWDIIKGIEIKTGKIHFWLKSDNIIFDPSLSIVTREDIFNKNFKQLKEIKNEEVENYLRKNNNLYKFYHNGIFKKINCMKNKNFSILPWKISP